MPRVPAICENCGLAFGSDYEAVIGSFVIDSRCDCPRCGSMAPVVNGYTTMIGGLVAFIASPEYPIEVKRHLLDTAKSFSRGEISASLATRSIEKRSVDGGKLFREWVNSGSVFVGAMATAGLLLLTYMENRKNEPPEYLAMEVVDDYLRTTPQAIRPLRSKPDTSFKLGPNDTELYPLAGEDQPRDRDDPSMKENRKARRIRASDSRSRRSKPRQ